ncbi:FAD-binding domain-containing protein, partial [Setomelanomma holmii]
MTGYLKDHKKIPYNAPADIPRLDQIVEIDLSAQTAKVEANVSMGSLVKATLPLGLVPSVVAGQRGMTVADAFANMTSESSSFSFGAFDCTVLEIEIITGDGEIVRARPDWNEDLFYGSAGTMHSLGLITMLEISLTRRGPYVRLEFIPLAS